jgi:micrococcal nuclease
MDQFFRKALPLYVVDGDTIDLNIELGWDLYLTERVRLWNVDAPEVRGPEKVWGREVKEKVAEWLEPQPYVWLHSKKYQRDKYGRTIGVIWAADESTNLNDFVNKIVASGEANEQ